MFKINYKIALVIIFNIIVALAYYIDNKNAYYSELSSDIQNIIPVAQKFDDTSLFQHDTYLNDINNVKYYTPFYVQSLRFIAKYTNYNYVQAVNVLATICHVLFGILWFLLLSKFINNYWLAFGLSVLIRGIVWLPGLEIWGISDLWSIMPRTVYITLMPLPFLILSNSIKNVVISSFLIGVIFNFHPISGLGGILLFLLFLVSIAFVFKKRELLKIKPILSIILAVSLGMLPFLLTYFQKTSTKITYNIIHFNEAFSKRIPDYFTDVILFLEQWLHLKTLALVMPVLLLLILSKYFKTYKKVAIIITILLSLIIIIPAISIPIENFVNQLLSLNLRMSFQLIRIQKMAVVPCFFAIGFVLKIIVENSKKIKQLLPFFFTIYITVLVFSQSTWFTNILFFSDDISKSILPSNLSVNSQYKNKKKSIDKMADFIINNTKKTDVICGSFVLRGITKRSVVFDGKGSSMLIEGNPSRFTYWYTERLKIRQLKNSEDFVIFLKQHSVDYLATYRTDIKGELVHKEGRINLYKL